MWFNHRNLRESFEDTLFGGMAPSCGCIARSPRILSLSGRKKRRKNPTARKGGTAFQSLNERVLCKWVKVEGAELSDWRADLWTGEEEEEEEEPVAAQAGRGTKQLVS